MTPSVPGDFVNILNGHGFLAVQVRKSCFYKWRRVYFKPFLSKIQNRCRWFLGFGVKEAGADFTDRS